MGGSAVAQANRQIHARYSSLARIRNALTLRKYLVLLNIIIFGPAGDALLARGMKPVPAINVHDLLTVFSAVANPFVIFGIVCLIVAMSSYMTALSFADLSYVLPATAAGYVVMTLLSIFWLHEHVSPQRWAGVALIVIGVGLIAGAPHRTKNLPDVVYSSEYSDEVLQER